MDVMQQSVKDEGVGTKGPASPHRIEAKHDDVAMPELGMNERGGAGQFLRMFDTATNEQLFHVPVKSQNRPIRAGSSPTGKLSGCSLGLLELGNAGLTQIQRTA